MPKTRRRGCIRKRGENSWHVSLFLGIDSNGKRKFHQRTIRGTRKEADQYLTRVVRERDLGTFVDTPSITLSEYFDKWLQDVSRIRTAERTTYGRESIYRRYFHDTIGYKKLEKLTVLDFQKIYSQMLARGLEPQTVKHAHAVVNCALKQTIKWGLLPRNPAEFAELPRVPRKERRVLSPEESRRFILLRKALLTV
jgi:hypothetical protein